MDYHLLSYFEKSQIPRIWAYWSIHTQTRPILGAIVRRVSFHYVSGDSRHLRSQPKTYHYIYTYTINYSLFLSAFRSLLSHTNFLFHFLCFPSNIFISYIIIIFSFFILGISLSLSFPSLDTFTCSFPYSSKSCNSFSAYTGNIQSVLVKPLKLHVNVLVWFILFVLILLLFAVQFLVFLFSWPWSVAGFFLNLCLVAEKRKVELNERKEKWNWL